MYYMQGEHRKLSMTLKLLHVIFLVCTIAGTFWVQIFGGGTQPFGFQWTNCVPVGNNTGLDPSVFIWSPLLEVGMMTIEMSYLSQVWRGPFVVSILRLYEQIAEAMKWASTRKNELLTLHLPSTLYQLHQQLYQSVSLTDPTLHIEWRPRCHHVTWLSQLQQQW